MDWVLLFSLMGLAALLAGMAIFNHLKRHTRDAAQEKSDQTIQEPLASNDAPPHIVEPGQDEAPPCETEEFPMRALREPQEVYYEPKQREIEEELRRPEEERENPEEEARRSEELLDRSCEDEEHPGSEGEPERKRVEPGKRGGRPRVSTREPERRPGQETKPHCFMPEIVCWKRERQWILGVEVPQEILDKTTPDVFQDESPLQQEENLRECWRLGRIDGQVTVRWTEEGEPQERTIALGDKDCLLFKLCGDGRGRRVTSPSSGEYLAVVPDGWTRDEALSGPPSSAPEAVAIEGYQAHFFSFPERGGGKIAFHTTEGRSVTVDSRQPRFRLTGKQLNDASETMGLLFGQQPPQIQASDPQEWESIGTIVIGEEGTDRGRWREGDIVKSCGSIGIRQRPHECSPCR